MGSSLYSHIKHNKLESSGNSITEGIGTGRITKNFDKALVDDAFQTNDMEALNLVYDLIEKQRKKYRQLYQNFIVNVFLEECIKRLKKMS